MQLRAMLRAGAGRDLRIMFPMIATTARIHAARKAMVDARDSNSCTATATSRRPI